MDSADSVLDPAAVEKARRLLAAPRRREALWPVLAAAAFAAVSAMSLALTTVLAPPARLEHLKTNAYGEMVRR